MSDFTKQHNLTIKAADNPSWYTDTTCEGCDICTFIAPENFARNLTQAYLSKQPISEEESNRCREAAAQCPSRSIGSDGRNIVFEYIAPTYASEVLDGVTYTSQQ